MAEKRDQRVALRLSKRELADLDQVALDRGLDRSATVRALVADALAGELSSEMGPADDRFAEDDVAGIDEVLRLATMQAREGKVSAMALLTRELPKRDRARSREQDTADVPAPKPGTADPFANVIDFGAARHG